MKTIRLLLLCLLVTGHMSLSSVNAELITDLNVQRTLRLGTHATGTITPAQITANQNDYTPTGYATAGVLRLSTDAARSLTGLSAGLSGEIKLLENVGIFDLVLVNASASSTAANRFALSADYTMPGGSGVIVQYDATAARWRLLGSQGATGSFQPLDASLTAYAALTTAANKGIYYSGADTPVAYDLTSFGRTLGGLADYAALRTGAGLVLGTNVQAYDTDLTTYAGITPSANVQTLLGAADFAAFRTSLSLVPGADVLGVPASSAEGDILLRNATLWTRLPRGTTGQVLKATASTIEWGTDSGGMTNPMTTAGDLIIGGASGAPTRKAIGTDGQVLKVVSGVVEWGSDSTGSGSLPATPAEGDLAFYDGADWVRLAIGTAAQVLKVNATADAPVWDAGGGVQTIFVPAGAMTPSVTSGCAALSTMEISAGQPDVSTLGFDASIEQYAQFSVAMPKSWDNGTVTVQFLWSHASTTTNFGVVWAAQALAVSSDDTIGAAFGTAQTVTSAGGTTNDLYISSATAAITVGGTPATGDLVYFRLYRVAANGSDTLAINARLHGVRVLYTVIAPNDN